MPARLVADAAACELLDRRNGIAVVVECGLDEHERSV